MTAFNALQKFPQSILNQEPGSFLGRLWSVISSELDEIEIQLQALKDLEYIYYATGVNLDVLGELLNETRVPGQGDDTYRLFILIAISKRLAKGTLPEIIEIGKNIAGLENGTVFIPQELYSDLDSIYLDALSLLDGLEPLDPSSKSPASFELDVEGDVNHLKVPTLLAKAVDSIRPAGVYAKTRIRFLFIESNGREYTARRGVLDGTSFFDGLTLRNPQANYAIDQGAIGDGGIAPPGPSDTGLTHELSRKPIHIQLLPDGTREYTISLSYSELNGDNLNELAFFSGGRLVFKDFFDSKPKDSTLVYDFKLKETAI
ncbi:hypothetical protein LEP1GSC058_3098 [Leptospira fainei serovar Hurstbridge str. BUT 6]|uniref:Uncharacterized protein n=1 Tax=Leptospira fainei serovar Hurstbridge str. BUT 6 TaxID=1193011 RepID=S3UZD0_9LEPT|nr:hypothetical protein [Leptospira fainei]EPG73724.1 hypothetical protein LEP1GSC058_3098 [Leptospira fainei serovar Hurstbridge str. BUT 6]